MTFRSFLLAIAAVVLVSCAAGNTQNTMVPLVLHSNTAAHMRPAAVKTTLYSFTGGHDGGLPVGGLVWDGSHFWGVTEGGGTASCGCGVIYAIDPKDPSHLELYQFNGGPDGAFPQAAPILLGNRIVGTTAYGGNNCAERSNGCGTIWSLDPQTGREEIVHAFNGTDGIDPMGLTTTPPGRPRDATTFLGVAKYGGRDRSCERGCGTQFAAFFDGSRFTAADMLGRFGGHPEAAPVFNPYQKGYLFTATAGGGTACPTGCGSVLQYDNGGFVLLDNFRSDLGYDAEGGVTNDVGPGARFGNRLYGTTASGGSPPCSCGTIYTLDLAYAPGDPGSFRKIRVEHHFEGGSDGARPVGPLVGAGTVYYGTTLLGGGTGCGGTGCGTVYEFDPTSKSYRVVYRFAGGEDGAHPTGLAYLNGTLYGITSAGGAYGHGSIYALTP